MQWPTQRACLFTWHLRHILSYEWFMWCTHGGYVRKDPFYGPAEWMDVCPFHYRIENSETDNFYFYPRSQLNTPKKVKEVKELCGRNQWKPWRPDEETRTGRECLMISLDAHVHRHFFGIARLVMSDYQIIPKGGSNYETKFCSNYRIGCCSGIDLGRMRVFPGGKEGWDPSSGPCSGSQTGSWLSTLSCLSTCGSLSTWESVSALPCVSGMPPLPGSG